MTPSTRKKRKLTLWSVLLLSLNVTVIFLTVAGFAAAYIPPDKYWPFAFAGLMFPYLIVANLFLIILWIVLLKRYFLLSLLTLLLCYNRLTNYIQLDKFDGNDSITNNAVKLISYNVQIFDLYNWKSNRISQNGHGILNLLKSEQADIICLQEYHAGKKNKVDIYDSIKLLTGLKHSHLAFVEKDGKTMPYGIATYSRWPIINKKIFDFKSNPVNFCVYSDIIIKEDTIRLFNVHLESIKLSNEDYLFVEELPKAANNQNFFSEGSKKILRKFKSAFINRATQARELAKLIQQSPYPVIVCGDFNDTPSSYTYHQLTDKLADAFKSSGSGLGKTYSGSLPSFRIDYILHDKKFRSVNYQTLNRKFSDHYPITTSLLLK